MVRTFMILAFLGATAYQSKGCDVCGGFVNSGGIGLVANYQNNLIGLRWFSTAFHANAPSEARTKDDFKAAEFVVQYRLNSRFRLTAFQTYKWNRRQTAEGNTMSLHGLADTRLWAHYALMNRQLSEQANWYWDVGAGLKFPFGKYDPDIHEQELPENFNVSNGSWGYLMQSNMVVISGKWGLNASGSLQLNGESSSGYHFGRQLAANLLAFRRIAVGENLLLTPYVGSYFERLGTDEYANGKEVPGTGGNGHYLQGGIQLSWADWQLGFSTSQPLSQRYAEQETIAKGRYSINLSYYF